MKQTIYKTVQDWEFAEEVSPDEWETIDIQIDNEEKALKQAQIHANETGHRCAVSTSLRYELNGAVEDRGLVNGDPLPIIVEPQNT